MTTYTDPFLSIHSELSKLKELVIEIKNKPSENYNLKYYTRKEVAQFTNLSVQTIDNYIDKGYIKVERFGLGKPLIHHFQVFNKDNSLKEFKYKRKA